MRRVGAGSPESFGVNVVPGGVDVAVYSAHATSIELCLFDASGGTETERIALPERTGNVFHGFVADVARGTRYGLRASPQSCWAWSKRFPACPNELATP